MRTHALNKLLARNISGLVLIVAWGGANPALAQSQRKAASAQVSNAERANARTHALAAFDALDAAKYEQAVQEFGLALELIDAPTLRVGRAEALTKLDRWIEAASDYEAALRYTVLASDAPAFAESQKTAGRKLAELRARTPVLVIQTGDATAQVTIDDYAWKPVRSGEEIAIDPGPHRVVVTAFEQTVTHRVDAAAGAQINLQGPTQPEAGAPGPAAVESAEVPASDVAETASDGGPLAPLSGDADTSREGGSDTRLWVSSAVTGALVVGAVATGIMYWKARNSYDDSRKDATVSDAERQDKYDDTKTMAWVNTGLAAAAVVGAGVTTYFWLAPRSSEQAVGRGGGAAVGSAGFNRPDGFTLGIGGRF